MWFNPLAYMARNAFRTDQEAACDADVLRRCQTSPHAYGATLIKAARLHLPEPAIAAGRLPLTHALKERLARMTYPAPSSRRRKIGFGAALVFAVSTLAITSSVAVAAEPKDSASTELGAETKGLWIADKDDRQIVLLGDPMAKVIPQPPAPPQIDALTRQIDLDIAELTGLSVPGAMTDMTSDPDFIEITRLSMELAGLGASLGIAMESLSMDFFSMSEAEIEAWAEDFEKRMEAKAADIEARAEQMEIRMEVHSDRLDKRMDDQSEARMMKLEHRIEASAAEIKKIMEERFGSEFEARVEAQAALIGALVDSCENAELAGGEARILERAGDGGEIVRLACVGGARDQLKAGAALAAVRAHPGITEAEVTAFKAVAEGQKRKPVMVLRSHETETPKTPLPPKTPKMPVTPVTPETPLSGE